MGCACIEVRGQLMVPDSLLLPLNPNSMTSVLNLCAGTGVLCAGA